MTLEEYFPAKKQRFQPLFEKRPKGAWKEVGSEAAPPRVSSRPNKSCVPWGHRNRSDNTSAVVLQL